MWRGKNVSCSVASFTTAVIRYRQYPLPYQHDSPYLCCVQAHAQTDLQPGTSRDCNAINLTEEVGMVDDKVTRDQIGTLEKENLIHSLLSLVLLLT